MVFRAFLLAIAIALTSYSLQAVEPKSEAELAKARAELQTARDELHTLTKRIAELSMQLGKSSPEAFAFRYLHDPDRAMIGIVMAPGTKKDIRINAVTPGGPAAKAGVRAGDILMSVNGKSLHSTVGATDDSNVETARTLLKELKEGEKVKLIVHRDDKPLTFEIKAERRESWDWAGVLGNLPEIESALAPLAKMHGSGYDRNIKMIINGKEKTVEGEDFHSKTLHFDHDSHNPHQQRFKHIIHKAMNGLPWNALNLSTLNAGLGHYFGTDHGVLVLDTDDTSLKELKAGDVIQIIDGKPADNVSDVMRAIAAKTPGQPMQVEIWRDRKRQVITTIAPDRDQFMFPPPPAPPAPPPPAAPSKMSAPSPPPPPVPPELTSLMGTSV